MTHQSHGAGTSRFMRSRSSEDRRQYHRFSKHGLMARVGAKLVDVHDVSVGGIRLASLAVPVGETVAITLIPREGEKLNLTEAVTARGRVVGHVKGASRIHFESMSFTLAKFLIHHLARCNGIQPYIFK